MSSEANPVSILLVNLFYPERHPTIGFPVNVESLVGDLEGEFGKAVDIVLLDMQQEQVTIEKVIATARSRRFDIVGLSVKTGQREIAETIVESVLRFPAEARPKHLIIGGYRPRVYHEEFVEKYPQVLVCIGEGEPTMRGLVENIRGNMRLEDVPNILFTGPNGLYQTRRRQHDLTQWHPPGTSTLQQVLDAGGVVYLETSRGCSWGKCSFCHRKFSSGTKPSTIPVERIVETWAKFSRLGVRHVYCSDEDFLMNSHHHGRALGKALADAAVPIEFWVQTTIDGVLQLGRAPYAGEDDGIALNILYNDSPATLGEKIDSSETLAMLRKGGLRRIFFGLESGSSSQLIRYRKGVTAEEGARGVKLCRNLGLEVEVGFIPLDPLVSMAELRETVDFVRRNRLAGSAVKMLNLMCIQQGVAMYAKTKQAGLLTGERDPDTFLYPYDFVDSRAREIAAWIHNWHREGLSEFTYALRRLVDGNPSDPISTGFLSEIRTLEFDFLAMLVESNSHGHESIYDQCMRRRLAIMQRTINAVASGALADKRRFLEAALESSFSQGKAWMKQSEPADVLRL